MVEGYSSVGGLEAQISQVRDLIEIPLTRPGLFRQFGGGFFFSRVVGQLF